MVLELKDKTLTPRSGYTYTDPDTGCVSKANSLRELIDVATKHRMANNMTVQANFYEIIEHDLCTRNPPNFNMKKKYTDEEIKRRRGRQTIKQSVKYNLTAMINTTSTLIGKRVTAGKLYELLDSEISQRVKTCRACEQNVQEPVCYSCKVESVFSSLLGNSGRKHASFNGNLWVCACGVDGTFTKAVLKIPKLNYDLANNKYPEDCWKRKAVPRKEVNND